jgi:hypothetical protein
VTAYDVEFESMLRCLHVRIDVEEAPPAAVSAGDPPPDHATVTGGMVGHSQDNLLQPESKARLNVP